MRFHLWPWMSPLLLTCSLTDSWFLKHLNCLVFFNILTNIRHRCSAISVTITLGNIDSASKIGSLSSKTSWLLHFNQSINRILLSQRQSKLGGKMRESKNWKQHRFSDGTIHYCTDRRINQSCYQVPRRERLSYLQSQPATYIPNRQDGVTMKKRKTKVEPLCETGIFMYATSEWPVTNIFWVLEIHDRQVFSLSNPQTKLEL